MPNNFLKIRSRHPSHDVIRQDRRNGTTGIRTGGRLIVFRLGSTTAMPGALEINTIQSVQNSADKKLMKECFSRGNVKTADWFCPNTTNTAEFNTWLNNRTCTFIIKKRNSSRGRGIHLAAGSTAVNDFFAADATRLGNYIVEVYHDYNREYRLHVTANGCFYACRKVLKSDTPPENRWYRNDSNSNWIVEENELFDRPVNWDAIVQQCVAALNAVGLTIGACDLRVQSRTDNRERVRENPEFIVVEINSAPSMGARTAVEYRAALTNIIQSM